LHSRAGNFWHRLVLAYWFLYDPHKGKLIQTAERIIKLIKKIMLLTGIAALIQSLCLW